TARVVFSISAAREENVKKITIDADLRARLGGGTAKVTLTDEAGNPVGHYLPDDLYRSICDALIPAGDDDRTAARNEYQRGEGVTTPELLASIRETLARWDGRP